MGTIMPGVNGSHVLGVVDVGVGHWSDHRVTAIREVTDAEVTVVIRVSAVGGVVDAAGRLAGALRSALDLTDADVVVEPPPAPALRVLVDSRRVLLRGVPVELTRLEFDLLHHLCAHPRRVHRRSTLMSDVWGATSMVDTRTVDVHVRRIRRKLGDAAALITTVRGVGYRVDDTAGVSVEREG